MKKLSYILVFLISFFLAFVFTFPAKTAVSYILTKNHINYSKIQGDIFNLRVYDLEVENIYIPVVYIDNNLVKITIYTDPENYLDIDLFKRKAKLKLTELKLENYQKKPQITGQISTSIKFTSVDNFIVSKGNGNLLLRKFPLFNIGSIQVRWKLKPEDNKSKVNADITGKNISGTFKGYLILPIKDRNNIRLKGNFEGRVFGRHVKQIININPLLFKGF